MPAPPLAAKGSAGKGEDSPHLLVLGPGLTPANRTLSPVSRLTNRMSREVVSVNENLSHAFVILVTNRSAGEAVAREHPSVTIAGAAMDHRAARSDDEPT